MTKRANGTGSIYRRKDNKTNPWTAAATSLRMENGIIQQKRVVIGTFPTKKAAQEALFRYQENPTDKYNILFSDVYAEWKAVAFPNISKQLQGNYTASYQKLAPLYGMKFREVRTAQMQQIIDQHRDLSRSSLSKIKILLTQLFDYAMENDILQKNYAKFLVLPKEARQEKECFSELEVRKIEQAANVVPFADLILAMCYTGFRISEFLELTPFSYDRANSTLTGGKKTAAGKGRIVPIHPKIAPIIDRWASKGGQTIFCKEDGTPYSAAYFRKGCYYPALERIGIRKLSPHATRHTFATMMSKANVRPEEIQKLIGHADYSITANVYTHTDVSTLREAIRKI